MRPLGLGRRRSGPDAEIRVANRHGRGVARARGERLARRRELPVEDEDERFTSVAAERTGKRGGNRDDIAAALLLQQFIDRRRKTRHEVADAPA